MLMSDGRHVHTDIGQALGTDYFLLRSTLTESELAYLERTRRFVHEEVLPVINSYWERAEVPVELCRRLGELGLVGDGIEGYGCPPMSATAAGLINMELNRGDGSLGTFLGVQAGLAMRSIAMLGSPEQRERWLPGMAALDKIGAFALTEPLHRQRNHRRRHRRVGARRRRRQGQGLPGREGRARSHRPQDRGQGVAAG